MFIQKLFLWLLILIACGINAQVNETFLDGDFATNPNWKGDSSEFKINTSKQLQLNAVAAGSSYVSTPDTCLYKAEWSFWVKLSFAPSDNNNFRYYLSSDQQNLEGPLNGYFIRMGENGSADGIDLWEQSGTTETKIIDGIAGHCAKTVNTLRIKVLRDSIGNWALYADTLGANNFILEGNVVDNKHTIKKYSGLVCNYTVSNITKFYIDDIYCKTILNDKLVPVLDSVSVNSSTRLKLYFNEAVDVVTAQTINNYVVNNALGNPSSASIDSINPAAVNLYFSTAFTYGLPYVIQVSGVKDAAGNMMATTNKNFIYQAPPSAQYGDVVITEIFADPSPIIGLPSAEFVEVYNKSNTTLIFKNWQLSDATSSGTILNATINAGTYLIICNKADTNEFKAFGKTAGCTSFPSLNNAGDLLILKNEKGIVIDSVHYSDTWYKNETKKDGGWSLEKINFINNASCLESGNWIASQDIQGGTPGKQNSVFTTTADTIKPIILSSTVDDSLRITICFSEEVQKSSLNDKNNFNMGGNSIKQIINNNDNTCITIEFENIFNPANNTLTLSNINDCSGNILQNASVVFNYAQPQYNNIVINEILYDPKTGGVEFVEIFNRATIPFDLKNLAFASWDTIANTFTIEPTLTSATQIINPGEYFCISASITTIKQQYIVPANAKFLESSHLPSLNNSGDAIGVLYKTKVLDQFKYYPSMHYPLLNETKGVSLERINPHTKTQDNSNWHSAASSVGYATPGYQNSQYRMVENEQAISVHPEIFSPDNDGYNDVLTISYQLEKPGYTANIFIYDKEGRKIKHLIKNELLAQNGSFVWDGITESQEKASIGIYILYIELIHPEGTKKEYKKTCTLGGKM